MRDSLTLTTDIYIPKNQQSKLPCILLRSPINRAKYQPIAENMASWGYAIAVQSLRSHSDTENHPVPYITDAWGELQDGCDTVEWLAQSEYTDGNIGTYGESAMGIVQLLLAPAKPPHLKCQYIQVATPSLYHHAAYIGGKLCKHQVESWFSIVSPKAYESVLDNPEYGPYWERIDAMKMSSQVQTPAIHVGGWYDIFSQGTLDAYSSWQNDGGEGARGKQKLVMGPWTHWRHRPESLGEFPIPKESLTFVESKHVKGWFDAHLKGDLDALDNMPNVSYYVMGPLDQTQSKGNCWKTANSWPPKTKNQINYFSKNKLLKTQQSLFSSNQYKVDYNPQDPLPTVGGRNLYLLSGPFDQSDNEKRDDVISFTSEVLKEDTEVTGRIYAVAYLSSTLPQTDISVFLTDVYPNGQSVLIVEGIQTVKLVPGEIQKVEVDLWSTSQVFAKGHQIRVNISHSNYPHFDKNDQAFQNTIYVGKKYPSHISLPVVE